MKVENQSNNSLQDNNSNASSTNVLNLNCKLCMCWLLRVDVCYGGQTFYNEIHLLPPSSARENIQALNHWGLSPFRTTRNTNFLWTSYASSKTWSTCFFEEGFHTARTLIKIYIWTSKGKKWYKYDAFCGLQWYLRLSSGTKIAA